eukprot:INCI4158.2.p1 GENE.INCI4158.2~~INCI4158.2.p1  ORF type:complete len:813 (-),score=105.12 INCI4158.2:140-2236(-)
MEDDASETQLVCRRRIVAENEEEGHAERAQDLPRSRPAAEPGTRQSAAAATPGREEVLLDLNTIFPTARYLCLGRLAVSPDHKYLAFTLDETGEERFSCYIKHLASGRLEHRLDNANCIEWANTTKPYALYFTSLDDMMRPSTAHRFVFSEDSSNPKRHSATAALPATELVHVENDEAFFLSLKKTKDLQYIGLCSNSKTTAEIRLLNANEPVQFGSSPNFQLVQPRTAGLEYFVDHSCGHLFVLHNGGSSGPDYFDLATVAVPPTTDAEVPPAMKFPMGCEHWQCIVAGTDDRVIDDMDVFSKFCVLYTRLRGYPEVVVLSNFGRAFSPVPDTSSAASDLTVRHINEFPSRTGRDVLLLQPGVNAAFDSDRLVYSVETPLEAPRHFLLNLQTLESTAVASVEPVPGGSPSNVRGGPPQIRNRFTCRMETAISHDGLEIPMTLVHRADLQNDGSNPMLLRGYGAYGDWLRPEYEPSIFPLLDRGFVVATAHVRGGGELGRRWYHQGYLDRKKNSFHDFIACATHSIDQGYTRPEKLAVEGTSAGGLLVAMILQAPFVDVVGAMTDPSRPLTIHEYDEWGNPDDPEVLEYMMAYCPTQVLAKQHAALLSTAEVPQMPAALISMAVDDTRVEFSDVARYALQLRKYNTVAAARANASAPRPVLLHTHGVRGHGGGGGRYQQYTDKAFAYAFLMRTLGLDL